MYAELDEMLMQNRYAEVEKIEVYPLEVCNSLKENFFFCGAVADDRGHIIGIPNKYPHILEIEPEKEIIQQWGEIHLPQYKGWTGGAKADNGIIYGFPRGANSILKIDTERKDIEYIPLNQNYDAEHHYGGAITDNNILYLAPKNTKNILRYDIEEKEFVDIYLQSVMRDKFVFYGAISDLMDNVFFFPAGEWVRVAMIDKYGKGRFIGKPIRKAFFNSGTLAPDGRVYGFSSYGKGILCIDPYNYTVKVLEKSFHGGFFGAKLGFNGKIYGVPGDSDEVVEFDPVLKTVTNTIQLPNVEKGAKAKCAGAAIDRYGNIWCVPAKGHYIYKIEFKGLRKLPSDELYCSKYFASTY